jgi:hypothetical protein
MSPQTKPKTGSDTDPVSEHPVSETPVVQEEANNILITEAPINEGRYGVVPEDVHNIIIPNTPFEKCFSALSTVPCVVRLGIAHEGDSLMRAIAAALGMHKNNLIALIQQSLDPLGFLALDDGKVVQSYLSDDTTATPQQIAKTKAWLAKYPDYNKLVDLSVHNNLLRHVMIYQAYFRFLHKLASNDTKPIYQIIEVLACVGVNLIVLEKTSQETAEAYCPSRLIEEPLKRIVVLLKDRQFFEPIVLKRRSKPHVSVFEEAELPGLMKLLQDTCDRSFKGILSEMHGFKQWTETMIPLSKRYLGVSGVILTPDLQVQALMTSGNYIIKMSRSVPTSVLPGIAKIFDIKNLYFYEDLVDHTIRTKSVTTYELKLFQMKVESIGMTLDTSFGFDRDSTDPIVNEGRYVLRDAYASSFPAIRVTHGHSFGSTVKDRQIYQVRQAITKTLLEHYDTLVVPLLKRKDATATLMNTFKALIHGSKDYSKYVRQVLETIPYKEGRDAILRWQRMGYADPEWTSDVIKTQQNARVFTQVAVEAPGGIPDYVISPPIGHVVMPSPLDGPALEPVINHIEDVPEFLKVADNLIDLPTKWRSRSFKKFQIIDNEYKRDSFEQLVTFLSKMTGITLVRSEIDRARKTHVLNVMKAPRNRVQQEKLLSDISLFAFLSSHYSIGRKFKSVKELLDHIGTDTNRDRNMAKVFAESEERLWPTDIDMAYLSKLLDITIFVIRRADYNSKDDKNKKRNDEDDRMVSSTILVGSDNWQRRPVVFLYKESKKVSTQFSVYKAVVNGKSMFYNTSFDELPTDVQDTMVAVHAHSI